MSQRNLTKILHRIQRHKLYLTYLPIQKWTGKACVSLGVHMRYKCIYTMIACLKSQVFNQDEIVSGQSLKYMKGNRKLSILLSLL